jgi:hypothetical protein
MARIINGALYVDAFNPTENPGEYTFESALFNNQTDATGNGAYDILPGFVIFTPVVDRNTSIQATGYSNRYTVTNVTYIDTVRISGTMIWDSEREETDAPMNGAFCLISETTPNLKIAIPAVDVFYPDVLAGSTVSAMLSDLINIMDKLSNSGSTERIASFELQVLTNGQTIFNLPSLPINKVHTLLHVNGLKYSYGAGADFTINGTVLTWTDNSLLLDTTDTVTISYKY